MPLDFGQLCVLRLGGELHIFTAETLRRELTQRRGQSKKRVLHLTELHLNSQLTVPDFGCFYRFSR